MQLIWNKLSATVLACIFVSASLTAAAKCPSPQGSAVDWWILFQQSSVPFFHSYVDSFDSHNISYHFPEKDTSVLSQFMDFILSGKYQQYMVYSYDVINIRNIAESLPFPTMLKWMHGIFATDYSLSSGVWLLHNNLLFPPFEARDLAPPNTKLWYNTVVGDTADNVFYICLSLDTESDVKRSLDDILSGNPTLLKSQLSPSFYQGKFVRSMFFPTSTFSLEESALTFLDCLNATKDETLTKCLFQFSSRGENPVTVTTRSRGTLKQNKGLCYDATSPVAKDFVSVTNSEQETKGILEMDTLFVLSNDPVTPAYGITCFGQDVAEYTEIVTVMICVKLPALHKELVKSAMITNFLCSTKKDLPQRSSIPQNDESPSVSKVMKHEMSDSMNRDKIHAKLEDSCDLQSCSENMLTHFVDDDEESTWKNPLHKSNKMSDVYKQLIQIPASPEIHLKVEETAENKILLRETKQKTRVIIVDHERDLQQHIIETKASIFALFCQRSCRYCQPVKEIFHGMSQDFDNCQFLIVDANIPELPDDLRVPRTPFVRFRGRSEESWVDYDGKKNDVLGLASFLSNRLKRSHGKEDSEEEEKNQVPRSSRRRRSLGDDFISKHISTYEKMGGWIPVFGNVDNVTYDVMTRVRSHYMKRRKWNSYKDIDKFLQTYFVCEDEWALRNAIDKSVGYSIPVDIDTQANTCEVDEPQTKQPKYSKMKCSETKPHGRRYSRYFKCVGQISEFNFINMTLITMRWIDKNVTCVYSQDGEFTLGAGLIKNTNDYEINHMENVILNNERICE